jgi:predicted metalloprotease with PDZ domain
VTAGLGARRSALGNYSRSVIAAACATMFGASAVTAETPRPLDIAYRVSVPEPASHRYEIEIAVNGIRDDTLVLQMPVWSPGRYGRMDFARNVQHFAVTDAKGAPVAWELVNGSRWRLHTRGVPAVRVSFRVFANALSGTFSVADTAHLNWNGASLFPYVAGHKPDPVRLTIVPPPGWHVINGASLRADQTDFRFTNYDFLIDTPTDVAPAFHVDSFTVDGTLYRAVTHLNGGDDHGQRARFVRDLEKIVRYENRVVAPPPIPMYTFLFNIGYAGGDGMEHLASTQIITSRMWSDSAAVLPGVSSASHEYFHVWNVKRIRPAALGPFDYENAQFEPSLWVAEGWTNYYGNIGLLRSGVEGRAAYYKEVGNLILNYYEVPARKWVSARMASTLAPYWDGAAAPMPVETWESFISYYSQGEALALLLDLEIRARTGGRRSLDDALRNVKKVSWDASPSSYYLQGRGYTEADVERAVSGAAGADLHAWFDRFVGGTDELPFAASLAMVGMRVTVAGEGAARTYTVDEDPAATPAQVALRDQWLSGTTTGEK